MCAAAVSFIMCRYDEETLCSKPNVIFFIFHLYIVGYGPGESMWNARLLRGVIFKGLSCRLALLHFVCGKLRGKCYFSGEDGQW